MTTKTKFRPGGAINVEDAKGKRYRIVVTVKGFGYPSNRTGRRVTKPISNQATYRLEDGTAVTEIDGNTFKNTRTGEILKRVEE